MVIDTSILLAILFDEKNAEWCIEKLEHSQSPLLMSCVNFAETLIILKDRQSKRFSELVRAIESMEISFVDATKATAALAAEARGKFPLNLGDCFAYATAKLNKIPILTLDRDFKRVDIEVVIP